MTLSNTRKIFCLPLAVAAVLYCSTQKMAAQSPAAGATITLTLKGTFASPPVSGLDLLELAGQQFTIQIVGNSSDVPKKHGKNWALFTPLTMKGIVYSGLTGSQKNVVKSSKASLQQTVTTSGDTVTGGFPIVVASIPLTVKAVFNLPAGTLSSPLLRPFASVALDTSNATITYSNNTASTVLAVQSGTIQATESAAAAVPDAVTLDMMGAEVIVAHGDGSHTTRSLQSGPVSLSAADGAVMLKLYASGVRDAADVRVYVGGRQVPVLYSGQAAYFDNLDEVHVLLPRSLAASGDVELSLSADGKTANPLRIQIQ